MRQVCCTGTLLTALMVCLLAGCREAGDRLTVSGMVTYKGEPVPNGSIQFIPHGGGKTMSGATITNGRFRIPADKGLEPGDYTVTISSVETPEPTDEPGGLPGKDPKERLPAKYNTKSTLTAEVKKGTNALEFKLD